MYGQPYQDKGIVFLFLGDYLSHQGGQPLPLPVVLFIG